MNLPARVVAHMRTLEPLEPGARVVVAVSGGADSTALLRIAAGAAAGLGWEDLAVAHLDHCLREESAGDAAFVADLAGELGLPLIHERQRPDPDCPAGPEAAARDLRYEFLVRVARERRADAIVTGHHMDDQAETVLFRTLRGTGPYGMAAMRPVDTPSPDSDALLVRPLLPFRHAELRGWLEAGNHPWREDPTNVGGNTRSRLRHEAFPVLEDVMGRDPRPMLARLAGICAAWVGDRAAVLSRGAGICVWEEDGACRFTSGFGDLPQLMQQEAARECIRKLRRATDFPDHDEVMRFLAAIASPPGSPVAGIRVEATRSGGVRVTADEGGASPEPWTAELPVPGRVLANGREYVAEVLPVSLPAILPRVRRDPAAEVVDADALPPVLVVRSARPGDRFQPLGAPAPARLTHYLQRRGVRAWERPHQPVAISGGCILWVPGQGIAHQVRVREQTDRLILLRTTDPSVTC